ncbi:MAG TPA: LCP family protein, partial [Candidatus Elarobacter sp.]|nr:LCP family protein [Candidatus Elarobacter sp.]
HDHDTFQRSLGRTLPIYVAPPEAVFDKDRIYLLVLGIDYNYDSKGMPYSKGARSDTIMVAGLDFPTRSVKLISVLRDSEATIDHRDAKINEAYALGGEKMADRVIGDFLGLPPHSGGSYFDRYVVINTNGLKEFVNAVGGVDVPVTETMNYDDNWGQLHIHFKPGMTHMDGYQAQAYTRFREDACSDPCRTKRQQQVIRILLAKLKAQKFNDLLHIGQLMGVINHNVMTNLSFDEEKSLAWSFKDANLADLNHMDTIGYVDTKQTSTGEVVVPDSAQKTRLVAELLGPYVNAVRPPASAISAVKPASVHLVIENGSGVAGLAGTASVKLKMRGYVVDAVQNADTFGYDTTQIRPASTIPFVGDRVRADLGLDSAIVAPATDATPGPRNVVVVIVGRDFAAATTTAAPAATAAPAH